ncbi:hypothetical protein [Flavobacterium adhaerens]|uniref:hypothetical protein n=1 Tax=Flavobacterium adhaerens TaxID=3149043 RepID=UPI0032B46417
MKNLFYILILFFCNQLFSQKITVHTMYKSIPPQEFSLEDNDFVFDINEGTLIKTNTKEAIENKFFIEFKKEFYDSNNDFYFVEYKTDFKKRSQYTGDKSDVGLFTIMYDKKDGIVLAVFLNLLEAENTALYLTEKGEESPKVKTLFE